MEQSKIAELVELYVNADSCDKDIFAEQRSNVLLVAGDHYARFNSRIWDNVRHRIDIPQEQKIRLTMNHTQKIHKLYVNSIVSSAPGVQVSAKDPKDVKSKKSAELRQKLLEYGKQKYHFADKNHDYADDYCGIGEVAVKLFWDPDGGEFVGYKHALDEAGQPMFDENQEPVPSKEAVFSGCFNFERIFGFNLLRSPSCQSMEESPWLMIRKMVETKLLKKKYAHDKEKSNWIHEDDKKTYTVFDAQRGHYSRARNQTLVREIYFRPSPTYPQGYYYHFVDSGILEEGELPLGIFPIFYAPYEKLATAPRGRGPIKHGRPYQAEINRCASKIAEHQMTLGDDKVITRNGSKMSQSTLLPGVRQGTVTGDAPVIIAGRSGDQYFGYLDSKINEYYKVMGVEEIMADKNGNVDPYSLLFKSASQRKMSSAPIQRFERFMVELYTAFIRMAPHYYSEDLLAKIVGINDVQNLTEITGDEDSGFQVTVEPASEEVDTLMGKQLVLSQALQYGAQQLGPEGVGKVLAAMPFADLGDAFGDLTLNSEIADNKILALNRGELPEVGQYEPHVYIIQKLTSVVNSPAFQTFSDQVKAGYNQLIALHGQAENMNQMRLQAAKNEYIPMSGAMVACDLYVTEGTDPNKAPKRWRVPYDALNWLKSKLDAQSAGLQPLESLPPEVQAAVMGQGNQMAGAGAQIPATPAPGGPPGPM